MKSVLKIIDRVLLFTTNELPTYIVFIGLTISFFYTTLHFYDNSKFEDLWGIYLSIIGVSAALSSIIFSYANTFDDARRNEIRKIGESYLLGTVNLISVLIIVWVAFVIKEYFNNQYIHYASIFIFSLTLGIMLQAGVSLNYGIQKTIKQILPRFYSDFDWMENNKPK